MFIPKHKNRIFTPPAIGGVPTALLLGIGVLFTTGTSAQTGHVCGTPIEITTLPYDDSGNTATYGNDYSNGDVPPLADGAVTTGTGSNYYLSGSDVVYAYTPASDQLITVSTTNDDDWIGLWAFTGCPFESTVGYHTSISGATRSIPNLSVMAGVTYYFVISTWSPPASTNYTIHVEMNWSAETCEGTPDPGATTGPSGVCNAEDFTLEFELDVAGVSGYTYQWETSIDGEAWENAPGNSTAVTYTGTQAEAHWYRVHVTCTDGGTGTSTPLLVIMKPIDECYCTASFSTVEPICNVTFADINNDSPGELGGAPDYEDFTDIVAQVERGATYTLSATGNTSGSFTNHFTAFFDWNGDGLFETAVPMGSINNDVCSVAVAVEVTVPLDAAIGITRMRVMKNYGSAPTDPCASLSFGQVEDYSVEVTDCVPGTPCISENGFGGIWNDDCECEENIGVGELDGEQPFAVYPNPASTELYITTPAAMPVHVKVYDMLGHLVMQADKTARLNIAHLAPASYMLQIMDAKGQIQARSRFVKE